MWIDFFYQFHNHRLLTCGIIKHKCGIDAKIIFNQSTEQKREYQYEDRTECKWFCELLIWIQKALPQFKDFEGDAFSSAENWILFKSDYLTWLYKTPYIPPVLINFIALHWIGF